ncbi:MAG: hypothetical protein ACFFC3_15045 [Candidatus Odinarchaeota archaeon]
MKGDKITQKLAQFFEIYEEIEFKNINLFFNELIFEKLQRSFDHQLRIIEIIKNVSQYTQKFKNLLMNAENPNLRELNLKLCYLKKELDEYLSPESFDN